jgi:hypothetical protein
MKKFKQNVSVVLLFMISLVFGYKETPEEKTSKVIKETEVKTTEKLPYDTKDTKGMLLAAMEANGVIATLKALKDVSFDYDYISPDGKKDISEERYIFNNETSWAKYTTDQVNFPPNLEGDIVQLYDEKKAFAYLNNKPLDDPKIVELSEFLRRANYFWFNMMLKLSDPGIISKYQEKKEIDGTNYDVLHVTYDSKIRRKSENNIYVLHINPKTRMVDSFYFSLHFLGVTEPVLHAQLSYTKINGIQVTTRRLMKGPTPDGKGMAIIVDELTKNVKFNNSFYT